MVFRRRSRSSIHPVNRIKHVIDSQQGATLGNTLFVDIVDTKDAPVLANTDEVETGSTINGIFIKCEIYATTSGALANAYFYLAKNPGNNLTLPQPNQVGSSDEKRFIVHQEMVMLQKVTNSNPRTLFVGIIVLPKGYRRNAPKDKWTIGVFSPGVNLDVCIQAHYKEFR